MKSSALRCANAASNGITTSSSTPSSATSCALRSSAVSSFGAASGLIDGERVRLERQHGVAALDHGAMAEMDAVELADGDAPRTLLNVRAAG